jgi:hypothetical protein
MLRGHEDGGNQRGGTCYSPIDRSPLIFLQCIEMENDQRGMINGEREESADLAVVPLECIP